MNLRVFSYLKVLSGRYNLDIKPLRRSYISQVMPEQNIHLDAARRSDVTKVNHLSPAEPISEDAHNRRLCLNIIPTDEEVGHLLKFGRVRHNVSIYRIEGFYHLRLGERSLNLLAQ